MPVGSFETLYEKWLFKKLMQILNDPTHRMRDYFDSKHSNRSGRFLLPKTNANHYKALLLPSALSVLMKIIIVNLVCTYVKTSAQGNDFQSLSKGEGGRERESFITLNY